MISIRIQASGSCSCQRIAPRDPTPDQLSALLRAALRAQVAQAQPAPDTWDRIRQRLTKNPGAGIPGDGTPA